MHSKVTARTLPAYACRGVCVHLSLFTSVCSHDALMQEPVQADHNRVPFMRPHLRRTTALPSLLVSTGDTAVLWHELVLYVREVEPDSGRRQGKTVHRRIAGSGS